MANTEELAPGNGTNASAAGDPAGTEIPADDYGIGSVLVWAVVGHCCASAVLLVACLHLLRRRPFSRYRLGCLLIVRWNCAADLLCLANKALFIGLNQSETIARAGRHATAWVCKLYHFADNATMTIQVWLLVLFALERAAMSLNAGFALKHFSTFRLRIGVAAAGAVALAGHLNYIWMFSIVARHKPSGRDDFPIDEMEVPGNSSGSSSGGSDQHSRQQQQQQRQQQQELTCGVLPEFHSIYAISGVLELISNAYAPVLLCGVCALLVLLGCLRSGTSQRLSLDGSSSDVADGGGDSNGFGLASNRHARRLLLHQPRQRQQQQQQQQQLGYESADLVNACARVLFLVLAIVCYPPLAVTGAYKARSVHLRQPVSLQEYNLLYYILQPLKNVLSAIAYCAFVCCVLLIHKHAACRRLLPHRYKQQLLCHHQRQPQQQQRQNNTCSETEIPLRPLGNSNVNDGDS